MLNKLLTTNDLNKDIQNIINNKKEYQELKNVFLNHFHEIKHLLRKDVVLPKDMFHGYEEEIALKYEYPLDHILFIRTVKPSNGMSFLKKYLEKHSPDLRDFSALVPLYETPNTANNIFLNPVMKAIWFEEGEYNNDDIERLIEKTSVSLRNALSYFTRIGNKFSYLLKNEISDINFLVDSIIQNKLSFTEINPQLYDEDIITKIIKSESLNRLDKTNREKFLNNFKSDLKSIGFSFSTYEHSQDIKPGNIFYNIYIALGGKRKRTVHTIKQLSNEQYIDALIEAEYDFNIEELKFVLTRYSYKMTKIKNTHAQDLIDYIRSNMNIFKKDISKPQLAKTDLMYTIRFLYNNRIKELFYFMLNHNIKIQPDDSNFIGDKKWLIDELIDELFDDLRDNNQDITDFIETMIEIKYIPSMNHKLVAAAFLNKINIIKQKYDNPLDFIITHKLTHKDYIPLVNALSKELGVKYEEAINCQEMLNFNNQDAFLNMISDHQMVFNETNISF